MHLSSEIFARRIGLPRPQTDDVFWDRDLPVEMDDDVVLLADRWVATATQDQPQPTVLVRSPYGRARFVGLLFGRLLAERGLQVVIQSVRGTFGSGGTFSPFDERADGLATLRWLREQPWHGGRIGMLGPSYLGLVQWAVAPEAGDDLAGLVIQVSASQFHGQTYAGGSLSLQTTASWLVLVAEQERRFGTLAMVRDLRRLPELLLDLPLSDLDEQATGAEVPWYREALIHPGRDDPYWVARDYAAGVAEVTAPVYFVGGWYDIFLPWMLEDFAALHAAGREPKLVIGPWTHTAPGALATCLRDGLGWLRSKLLDDDRLEQRDRVRVYVTGERAGGGWRSLSGWPPEGSERRLWLADDASLSEAEPAAGGASGSRRYRYDPADPTPSLGGPVLLARDPVIDNRPLETRADVLTYTSPVLTSTVEAIGRVRVELWIRASSPHFDMFARVCDVDPSDVSRNITDALARNVEGRFEKDEGDVWRVEFHLWPIGHRFAAGNRIRLQVSSGAHPRYARNPGTGEDPVTATHLEPVDIEVLHGPDQPSAVVLPGPAGHADVS